MEIGNYIEKLYTKAREIDPDVDLIYNDLNIPKYNRYEALDKHTQNLFRFLSIFDIDNIPIDGVGLDLRLDEKTYPSYEEIRQYCSDLDQRGLKVHISNLGTFDLI